jgi:hypothetical protein
MVYISRDVGRGPLDLPHRIDQIRIHKPLSVPYLKALIVSKIFGPRPVPRGIWT